MEATLIILAATAYAVQDEKPTKPDKYCYTVFYLDLQGNIDRSDSDTSCYPKKQQCEQNRPSATDDTIVTERLKVK
jgi:hypothetical protein